MSLFELTQVPQCSTCERPLLVAKKLRFDQLRWNSCTVQRNESATSARALLVQRARNQFLARPGFAIDANPRFAGSNPFNLCHYTLHSLTRGNDLVFADAAAQFSILNFEAFQLQRILDRQQKPFRRERLFKKIECAQPRGLHRHLYVRLP